MKPARIFLRWTLALVGVWLVLTIAIGIFAAEAGLHPGRSVEGPTEEQLAQSVAARNMRLLPMRQSPQLTALLFKPGASGLLRAMAIQSSSYTVSPTTAPACSAAPISCFVTAMLSCFPMPAPTA